MSRGTVLRLRSPLPSPPTGRRRRRPLGVVLTLGVVAGLLVAAPTAPASAAETTISTGYVDWGVKESWRNYVTAEGTTLSEGATYAPSGVFRLPISSGTYDDETRTTTLDLDGRLAFSAHHDVLNLTVWDLELTISAEEQVLTGHVSSRDLASGEIEDRGVIEIANLDVDAVNPVEAGGTTTWTAVPASLTAEAAPVFIGYYSAGQTLDPLSITYDGPGGKPEPEVFVASGTPHVVAANPVSLGFNPTASATTISNGMFHDATNDVIHLVVRGANFLRAYDATTLQPVGTPSTINANSMVTPAFDRAGSRIFAVAAGKVTVSTWHDDIQSYTTTDVDPSAAGFSSRLVWDAFGQRLAVYLQSGTGSIIRTWTEGAGGVWTPEDFAFPAEPQTTTANSWWGHNQFAQLGALPDGSFVLAPSEDAASPLPVDVPVRRLFLSTGSVIATDVPGTAIPASLVADAAVPGRPGFGQWMEVGADGQVVLVRPANVASGGSFAMVLKLQGNQLVAGPLHSRSSIGLGFRLVSGAVDSSDGTAYVADSETGRLWIFRDGEYVAGPAIPGLTTSALASNRRGATTVTGPGELVTATVHSNQLNLTRISVTGASPGFDEDPADRTVRFATADQSEQVTFTAEPNGSPEPELQWQVRAGGSGAWRNLGGETTDELTVTATAAANANQYRLRATNEAGRNVSEPATLTVEVTPAVERQVQDVSVIEGATAVFSVTASGSPSPGVTWQRRVGGLWQDIAADDENFEIDTEAGASTMALPDTNTDQTGLLFRARIRNAAGTVHSRTSRLTVNPAVVVPEEGVTLDGVVLEWTGSQEIQKAPPFGGSNYFSAGVSDGAESSYRSTDGDVRVLQVTAAGAETPATWATRAAHVGSGGTQLIRLGGGRAEIEPDGSASVDWDGAFSVNFYGGMVPFTMTDPELTVDEHGTGVLTADLSGYASSQENPEQKEPLAPVLDVTVATFSGVTVDQHGTVSVTPDYAGVELEVPAGQVAQNRTVAGWGSWPQQFVDFHFLSGISSYWYSSGGAADPYKRPSSFAVDFTDAEPVDADAAPRITTQPASTSATVGTATTLAVAATGEELTYRWQKRIGSLWLDLQDETGAVLTLARAVPEDAGSYRVRVTNTAGSVASATAVLTVTRRPSTLSINAPERSVHGRAVTVTVTAPGRAGTVRLTGAGAARTAALADGRATFLLPRTLGAGRHVLGASYDGDAENAPAVAVGRALVVARAKVSIGRVKVTRKPTPARAGRLGLTLRSSTGTAVAGTAVVTLTQGGVTKKVVATVRNGRADVRLPKLPAGSWRLSVTYQASADFTSDTRRSTLRVTR